MKRIIHPALLLAAFCLLCCLSGCAILSFTGGLVNGLTGSSSGTPSWKEDALNQIHEIEDRTDAASSSKPAPDPEPEQELSCKFSAARIKPYNTITGTRVQVVVELRNTGDVPVYVSDACFDLEDEDGHLVATEDNVTVYPYVLSPGDRAWLFDTVSLDETPAGDLTVLPRAKASRAKVPVIRYNVTEGELKTGSSGRLKVLGRVENNTADDEEMITVAAFLFNSDGYCIGVLRDVVSASAGERVGFECTGTLPDSVTADTVDHISVAAFPLQIQF